MPFHSKLVVMLISLVFLMYDLTQCPFSRFSHDSGLESPSTFHYRGSLALVLDKPQLAAYFLEKAIQFQERAVEEKQLVRSKVVRQYSDDLNVAFTRNQLGLAYKVRLISQSAIGYREYLSIDLPSS